MKNKLTYIGFAVSLCLIIGFLSSFAAHSSATDWYANLNKPVFTPPDWVFAPVWTLLYILMGISAGIVWARGFHHRWVKTALYHFGFQLLLNASWSVVFFGFKAPFWALLTILTMLVLILLTIRWFKVVNKLSAYLLIPYFLWACFAAVLNYGIWVLN